MACALLANDQTAVKIVNILLFLTFCPIWYILGVLQLKICLVLTSILKKDGCKGIHGWFVCGTSWSHRRVSWFPGEALAEPGNQETSRWDPADHHGLPFSPVNYLSKIYLFHTINSSCFQMLCYSHCVRHVCFGINWPITAPLSNGPWQWSGIAWSDLLLSFTFPYINWPITEGVWKWSFN